MSFVKSVINAWDPIDLLSHAPNDEYNTEIYKIQNMLYATDDYKELSKGIYKVFVEAFSTEIFNKTKAECILIARILLSLKSEEKTGDG